MQILCGQYDLDIDELDKEMVYFSGYLDRDKKLNDHLTKNAADLIKTKESTFPEIRKCMTWNNTCI